MNTKKKEKQRLRNKEEGGKTEGRTEQLRGPIPVASMVVLGG